MKFVTILVKVVLHTVILSLFFNAVAQPSPLPVMGMKAEMCEQYFLSDYQFGELVPVEKSNAAFDGTGSIERVNFDVGDKVFRNDVLAQLDDDIVVAQLRSANEKYGAAVADCKNAENKLERQRGLVESALTSKQSLENFISSRDSLCAKSRAEQAAVEVIESRISRYKLTAPFDGSVSQRYKQKGDFVSPGVFIYQLQSVANELRFEISEQSINLLHNQVLLPIDERRTFETNIKGKKIDVYMHRYSPNISQSGRVPVWFRTKSQAKLAEIKVGQTAQINIKIPIVSKSFKLPVSALREGVRGVWNLMKVIDSDNGSIAKEAIVEVLDVDNNDVWVRGGIEAEDVIIVNGLNRVVPNMQVSPQIKGSTGCN